MASRNFNRHQSLEKEVKSLHVTVTTDGSGDVSSIKGEGIESVSHAANTYTITLDDKYIRLLGASVSAGVQATHILENVAVDSTKTLDVTFSVTQASVDLYIILDLKNSKAGE